MNSATTRPPSESRTARVATIIAIVLWTAVLLGIFIRLGLHPGKNDTFGTYYSAGGRWLAGQNLYKGKWGFVYSPLVAAFFSPFALLPLSVGHILWRILCVAIFFGGIFSWLRSGLLPGLPRRAWPFVFIVLLPLALGNFNNGQANLVVIGLLLLGTAAVPAGRWNTAAICIAVAVFLKIYPAAIGLLLMVIHPRRFAWRFALALLLLGALSLVLHRPEYVLEQYRLWFAQRGADNRLVISESKAPHDLWRVIRAFDLPVSIAGYRLLQLSAAAALAALCAVGRLGNWTQPRLLTALFSLGCAWMVLFGPATESATFVLLAPATAFTLVLAFARPLPAGMRLGVVIPFVLMLLTLALNSFTRWRDPHAMAMQPLGALLFTCWLTVWILRPEFWKEEHPAPAC